MFTPQIKIDDNSFRLVNPVEFDALEKLVVTQPIHFSRILRHKHNGRTSEILDIDILPWINESTAFLGPEYSLQQRIEWILTDRTEFPICSECNQLIDDPRRFCRQNFTYRDTCSSACAKILKGKRYRETVSQIPDFYAQRQHALEESNLKVYGVKNVFQLEATKIKSSKTKDTRYGDPCYVNREQMVETRLARNNGVYWSDTQLAARQQTYQAHYGTDNNMKSAEGYAEYINGLQKTYGENVINVSQVQSVKDKKVQTCRKNFGVDYPQQSPLVQQHTRESNMKNFGVEHNAQRHDVRIKSSMRYTYNGLHFDSSPELALYIYLTDSKIPFEYQPDVNLTYEFEGKVSHYFPDFLIEGKLIELKGDQFIKEDGTWQCPWDHSKDAGYEAKHQCAVKNNVEIWTSKDYMQYVKHVEQKYGKGYLHQFKNKLKSETDEPELKPLAQDNIFV